MQKIILPKALLFISLAIFNCYIISPAMANNIAPLNSDCLRKTRLFISLQNNHHQSIIQVTQDPKVIKYLNRKVKRYAKSYGPKYQFSSERIAERFSLDGIRVFWKMFIILILLPTMSSWPFEIEKLKNYSACKLLGLISKIS